MSPVLGRRQILRTAGALGLLGLTGLAPRALPRRGEFDDELDVGDLCDEASMQAVCTTTRGLVQGPCYLDLDLVRSDITEGHPGVKSRLIIHIVRASDCTPIQNAEVDLWHNNALGACSGFASQGTQGLTLLDGVQFTDASGMAMFDTIYPGWYQGRTTHVHCNVRPTAGQVLTTQMYFNPTLSNRVYGRPPHSSPGPTSTTDGQDPLFMPATLMSLLGNLPGIGLQLELTIAVA